MHQTDAATRLQASLAGSVLPVVHVDLTAARGEAGREAHAENLRTVTVGRQATSPQQGDAH
jgi:hypothetical protein